MSIITRYRRVERTIYNKGIPPYDPFSETGRWRTNHLRYKFRHNNRIPNSDCPIETISKGKIITMSSVRDWCKTDQSFCISNHKFNY